MQSALVSKRYQFGSVLEKYQPLHYLKTKWKKHIFVVAPETFMINFEIYKYSYSKLLLNYTFRENQEQEGK